MDATIAAAREILRRRFGHHDFRPGQADIVASVLGGRDTLAVLPTGGGKSLCYQVPALALPKTTLVISPLISLMKDQVDRLAGRGVAAAFLNSTLGERETAELLRRVARAGVKLLYLAPERFGSADLRRALPRDGVSLIAVDEAHCISEWGHDFRPSFRCIAGVAAHYGSPPVVALTATATPAVRLDIVRQLRMRAPRVIVGGFDRANLHFAVRPCRDDAGKMRELVSTMKARPGPAVVYAPTRGTTVVLANRLRRAGCRAVHYHAGLDEVRRREAQEAFMTGRSDAIVATNAFGMGVDKPDVRLVVHYALPRTLESYYQEAGRAGRDGASARCVLLYASADRHAHDWSIAAAFPERSAVDAAYARLRASGVSGRVERSADPAIAFLIRHGAATERPALGRLVRVRVLATPERIRRVLSAPADAEDLAVLRALWRQGGAARCWEATVDLAALVPAMTWRRVRGSFERLHERRLIAFVAADGAIELVRPDATLAELGVDWDAIARRRLSELDKLATMQRYARSRRCRRAFVLEYFGEQAAPACAACDNCSMSWTQRLLRVPAAVADSLR